MLCNVHQQFIIHLWTIYNPVEKGWMQMIQRVTLNRPPLGPPSVLALKDVKYYNLCYCIPFCFRNLH